MTGSTLTVSRICTVLALGFVFAWEGETQAKDPPKPVFRIDITQASPGSLQLCGSAPIIFTTAKDQLVMVQGNVDDKNGFLASDDQGRTWHPWEEYATWPKIYYQDVAWRKGEILVFGCITIDPFKGTHVWWSNDKGKTWEGGNRLTPDKDRWVLMINRVLITSRGRIVVPIVQLLGREGSGPNHVGTIFSDDGGRSFQRSPIFGPPPGYPVKPEGIGEPAVVELSNGKMWMVCRGLGGHLWQAWSDDDGATWGTPSPTTLVSPLSAVNAKRLPGSDTVIVLWDNAKPGPSPRWDETANFWRPRSPLVFALSKDNCKTWSKPVIITTGTAAYPSICFFKNKMYVAYWEDPNPNALFGNPKSHLILVTYDLSSLL